MSSRSRSSSSSSRSGSISTEDEIIINDLLLKLETLIPTSNTGRRRRSSSSASQTLRETCDYIKSLHKQVDDLSDKLSEILAASMDDNTSTITHDQVEILRALLIPQHH